MIPRISGLKKERNISSETMDITKVGTGAKMDKMTIRIDPMLKIKSFRRRLMLKNSSNANTY